MAIDGEGTLYVANNSILGNDVTEYAHGHADVLRTISKDVWTPVALLVDDKDNLYVANYTGESVTVYKKNETQPYRRITDGVKWPQALALDHDGNLYVANGVQNKNFETGSVTEYLGGTATTNNKPIRTITDGIFDPHSLAFNNENDLFVASTVAVSVYNAGTVKVAGYFPHISRPVAIIDGP